MSAQDLAAAGGSGAAGAGPTSITLDASKRASTINLGAGPSMLPLPTLLESARALLDYRGTGMGVVEISHRSSIFAAHLKEIEADLRALLGIGDEFAVIFAQGGGTEQFSATLLNLMARHALKYPKYWQKQQAAIKPGQPVGPPADYAISGQWTSKAFKEAQRLGFDPRAVFDARKQGANGSASGKFGGIPPPEQWRLSDFSTEEEGGGERVPPAFLYYCDNETVDGVEYNFPSQDASDGGGKTGFPVEALPAEYLEHVPLVADMSSNILSRRIPHLSKHALIFFGAQKNVGPPGVTVVIVKRDLVVDVDAARTQHAIYTAPRIPTMTAYQPQVDNGSLYNTPPTFSIFVSGLVFQDLRRPHAGGVAGAEERSRQKSSLVYDLIDQSAVYVPTVTQREARSRMNIPFRLRRPAADQGAAAPQFDEQLEAAFIKACDAVGILQVKGHRSVGGIRTSLYNAVTVEQTHKLVALMKDFEQRVIDGKL